MLKQEKPLCFSRSGKQSLLQHGWYWEIAIKTSIGKLELVDNWPVIIDREMRGNFIKFLPITKEHCNFLTELPFHHRDPFDRMLVAQTKIEQMTLLSADSQLKKYEIEVIW
jgi:PIN domain nuclease of toxin-antitoxin system